MSAATTDRAVGDAPPLRTAGSGSWTPSALPDAPRPGTRLPGRGAPPNDERPHGARARYVFGPGPGTGPGCRCDDCRAANTAWSSNRTRQQLYGRWEPLVDAEPARKHVRALGEQGIGYKQVADLAGLSFSIVRNLLHGRPGREPAKRIRPETAAAILAVQPKVQDLWAGARVDATGTHRRLQALVALGHSQARLAARLGQTGPNFCRMMRASQVRAATARAVLDLYRELWLQPPPETTRYERNSASRARNFAEGHGWVLPAAWDDGAIDDPDARPAEGWKRSQRRTRGSAELAEEALDVMGQGHTREQAAERLGVSVAAIDKAFERTRGVAA